MMVITTVKAGRPQAAGLPTPALNYHSLWKDLVITLCSDNPLSQDEAGGVSENWVSPDFAFPACKSLSAPWGRLSWEGAGDKR